MTEAHLMKNGLNVGMNDKKVWVNGVWKGGKENLGQDDISKIKPPEIYISLRQRSKKCYSFKLPFIPNELIDEFQLYFRPDFIFQTIKGNNGKMKQETFFDPSGDKKISFEEFLPIFNAQAKKKINMDAQRFIDAFT